MKKLLWGLGIVVGVIVLGVVGFLVHLELTWEQDLSAIEKPAITASTDPEVIARGEYLAHAVAHCSVCHAPEEVTYARKPGDKPDMVGGYVWKMGPLGTLHSPNITPDPTHGIGAYSDAELARAIKWCVGKDGKLLAFMTLAVPPMADEDLVAVVSYLRSTKPVATPDQPHEPGPLLKFIAKKVGPDFRKTLLEGLAYAPAGAEPSLERGKYLAHGPGACFGCHTPFDLMEFKPTGALFSGVKDAEPDPKDSTMVYRVPNLTPDPETGVMAKWTEEDFVKRFRAGRQLKSSKMPWESFRDLTESDLRSVYRYLQSLPPAKNYIGPSHRNSSEDPSKDPEAPKSAA